MKLLWRMFQRFYEARSRRAFKASQRLKAKAEYFYALMKGVR